MSYKKVKVPVAMLTKIVLMQKQGSGGLKEVAPSFKVLSINFLYASGSDSAISSSIFHILSA